MGIEGWIVDFGRLILKYVTADTENQLRKYKREANVSYTVCKKKKKSPKTCGGGCGHDLVDHKLNLCQPCTQG